MYVIQKETTILLTQQFADLRGHHTRLIRVKERIIFIIYNTRYIYSTPNNNNIINK